MSFELSSSFESENKATKNLFTYLLFVAVVSIVHWYCYVFEKKIVPSKKSLSVSKLETWNSQLDSQFLKASRIEYCVSSRDCQLAFDWYCKSDNELRVKRANTCTCRWCYESKSSCN